MFKNIKWKKGFQRLFLSISSLCIILGAISSIFSEDFIYFLVGAGVGLFVYGLFVFFCWIINAFVKDTESILADFKLFSNFNYRLGFVVSCIICSFLIIFNVFQMQRINNLSQIKLKYEDNIEELTKMLNESDQKLSDVITTIEKSKKK